MASFDKVLIVVENLPVPFDRRVWMEATTLKKAGYQVSVICPTGKGYEKDYEVIDDIHIYRHPMPPDISSVTGYLREYATAVFWEFRLAHRVWRERGFNIVHICNPPDLLFLVAGWYKLLRGVRVIFDHHDINLEMYEAKYERKDIFYYGLSLAERLTFATADVVISTNESYREVALTRGKKKPEDIFVVRSGPDLSRFRPTPPNPAYRKNKKYLVGYVGVMGEPEGIDYLLKSVRYIVYEKQRQDIQFMLIGSGPMFEKLQELSEKLGVADYVEFTGRIEDQELLERLSSCDVCVNPDKKMPYNERSTMNKIMEYMAMGKPIVQFDLLEGRRSAAGASVYAKGNDEVDFAEKILELIEDPERRKQMGLEGQCRMKEKLEWRYQAPKLLDAYGAISLKNNKCITNKTGVAS
ncbi:MAG: glycosyltransferase family 4 protein [Moorea sp. SIO1G6]|uniref:Glycosyltransferase family 4 protein n=1 Tax=Moorena producens (strain JHB) TaxID=1454205 RepID=A0A1D9G9R1_MOOP1|nr:MULTISPECIES: glycosyltransferase family 4 protein [Moorena]AOY84353.1 glycosyltransferase family 4 protein [Moorena producens JHB]NET63570.1 glycosyltransferase family 4 protein [Moorena sp. SIO1G6]